MSLESDDDGDPAAGRIADVERASPAADTAGRTRVCSRRAVLGAALATTGVCAPVAGSITTAGSDATLQVIVSSGPTPLYARLRDGLDAVRTDWTSIHEAAMAAVADALDQIETYARETGRDWLDVAVDRGPSIGSPFATASPLDTATSVERVYDGFREVIGAGLDEPHCHLLCWWGPFDYRIGYGRTVPGDGRVGRGDHSAGLAIANVGATEGWDGRAVTRNVAIHEVLHTSLSPADAAVVGDSRCDHDLGAVREPEPGIREISPMATTYAGGGSDDRGPVHLLADGLLGSNGGTRWAGRGCVNPAALRERGPEAGNGPADGDVTWRHSTRLTAETMEAVCRYAERTLQ
ncbi:hypothetical protein C479_07016 [Halovivax asiaticus JCM 14624]|uniref:Uncharacterized protein n=1 Tax=Halovivax asiaticus JCM 14624 TaxID=1227490 RepID=M0BPS6_9EURY|nr:hypothetical protein [Halovivax asiaticus]ELZ11594.1 hypothetical protein C479_07016 [Halovivax asiaticus JCM 14624]